MRALGTTKGILLLSGIIIMLSLSQYLFPTPSEEQTEKNEIQISQDKFSNNPENIESTHKENKALVNVKGLQNKISSPTQESKKVTADNKNGMNKESALPEDVFNEITNKQVINELIDFLDNYEVNSKEKNVDKRMKDGHEFLEMTYEDGSLIKKGITADEGLAFVFKGLKGEKFSRTFYKSGSIREYMYINPSESIRNGVSFYETGEVWYRHMKNDNGIIAVEFNKDGSIKKITNKNYY